MGGLLQLVDRADHASRHLDYHANGVGGRNTWAAEQIVVNLSDIYENLSFDSGFAWRGGRSQLGFGSFYKSKCLGGRSS
ncbi:hypothetical protein DF037_26075 [Burkholderia contaminans]|uniref:Uncharacterized protein n=1 Tax=Burkholderia contaminans TaxID=488447 RepID=A0A3N8QGY6_9BURK|nr:hypothetical protein DF037_26075 [Burkholderia contaminans]